METETEIINSVIENNNSKEENNLDAKNENQKPPPIFIMHENPEEIKKILKDYKFDFLLKVSSKKQTKIVLKSIPEHRILAQKLNELGIEFFTFQSFSGKITRRIIRGLPINFDKEILKLELEKHEPIEVKNIQQLRHRFTKAPIPLFKIDIKSNNNAWKKLDEIKIINEYEIKIERIGIKQIDIPICKNCLQYGYTKNFCYRKIIWLICNDHHFSSECEKSKQSEWKPVCLHYKEHHFTTWKGCKFYKKLRKQRIHQYKKVAEECKNIILEEKTFSR
ncbi:unnamed protein product [Bemisia tabaci]|uniref:Pre-C2HC domain-containing protein n=1 Tax=Bemisia tabaci TaxID=7038 RepID=A0A9P0ABU7_BEMTA|nr:unnamed protein product [Bemisia tabaci]